MRNDVESAADALKDESLIRFEALVDEFGGGVACEHNPTPAAVQIAFIGSCHDWCLVRADMSVGGKLHL